MGNETCSEEMRGATRTGRPLGDEEFLAQLEAKQQRMLRRDKPGRRPHRSTASGA